MGVENRGKFDPWQSKQAGSKQEKDKPSEIVVNRDRSGFQASFSSMPGARSLGRSIDEAVGRLVRANASRLELKIVSQDQPPKQPPKH